MIPSCQSDEKISVVDVIELAVEHVFWLHKVAGSWWPLPYIKTVETIQLTGIYYKLMIVFSLTWEIVQESPSFPANVFQNLIRHVKRTWCHVQSMKESTKLISSPLDRRDGYDLLAISEPRGWQCPEWKWRWRFDSVTHRLLTSEDLIFDPRPNG